MGEHRWQILGIGECADDVYVFGLADGGRPCRSKGTCGPDDTSSSLAIIEEWTP